MNGLVINTNKETIEIGGDNGMICVQIDVLHRNISLFGLANFTHMKWNRKELNVNDSVMIHFTDINTCMPPEKRDEQDLSKLKKEYEQLRDEFIKKGWI